MLAKVCLTYYQYWWSSLLAQYQLR